MKEEKYREITRMDLEKEAKVIEEEMEESEITFWNQQKGEYHEIRN